MVKRTRKRKSKAKKVSKNNLYLPIIIILIIFFAFLLYYFSSANVVQPYGGVNGIPSTPTPETKTGIGGYCKTSSECFITYCKGQVEDCINSTQITTYQLNCKTYSDWVLENNQDYSVCACIQNACTMLK